MPTLLMFATAREASGERSAHFDALSLDALLMAAEERYGARFAAVLATSRIWINGDEPTSNDVALESHDQVAVIPPVAGG